MPTYLQKDTDSDLSPFTEFNKEMSAGSGTDAGLTVSGLNPGSPVSGGFITPAGVPNSDAWQDGGTWSVEVELDSANMQVEARVRCVRLDSAGTVLQSGAWTAAQALDASRTFAPVAPAWSDGEEACANRLAVELEFSATAGMNQAVTLGLGTTANEVVTDISEDAGSCAGTTRTLTGSLEAALAAVSTPEAALDSALRETVTRAAGLDAGLQAGGTRAAGLESALARSQARSAGADAALDAERTVSALAEAALSAARDRQAGLDGALTLARAGAAGLEAALRKQETREAGLEAAVQAAGEVGAALDAALGREASLGAALQAALRAMVTVAAGLDASLAAADTRSLDAALAAAVRAVVVTAAALDAALILARDLATQADAALAGTALLGAGLDARLDRPYGAAGNRTFGHGEARDHVVTRGGRTVVIPAETRKH